MAKIIYHNDLDGLVAAAICKKKLDQEFKSVHPTDLWEIDYSDEFPVGRIGRDEEVHILDFTPPDSETFKRLLQTTPFVTWIDHHRTNIDRIDLEGFWDQEVIEGTRLFTDCAAMQAWRHYFPGKPDPFSVILTNAWDLHLPSEKNAAGRFNLGMFALKKSPAGTSVFSSIWESLLMGSGPSQSGKVREIIEHGVVAETCYKSFYAEILKSQVYGWNFNGIPCAMINYGGGNIRV